jgi:hypothetical protein
MKTAAFLLAILFTASSAWADCAQDTSGMGRIDWRPAAFMGRVYTALDDIQYALEQAKCNRNDSSVDRDVIVPFGLIYRALNDMTDSYNEQLVEDKVIREHWSIVGDRYRANLKQAREYRFVASEEEVELVGGAF